MFGRIMMTKNKLMSNSLLISLNEARCPRVDPKHFLGQSPNPDIKLLSLGTQADEVNFQNTSHWQLGCAGTWA